MRLTAFMQLGSAFVNCSGDVVVKLPNAPVFVVLSDPLVLDSVEACSEKCDGNVRSLQANHSNPVYRKLCVNSVGNQEQVMVQIGSWDVHTQKFNHSIIVTVPDPRTETLNDSAPSFKELEDVVATLNTELYGQRQAPTKRERKRLCSTLV
jgi:hypothetical protein